MLRSNGLAKSEYDHVIVGRVVRVSAHIIEGSRRSVIGCNTGLLGELAVIALG